MNKLFKKIAALLLVFMLATSFAQLIPNVTAEASASASGECGESGVKWELENNILTISGEGSMPSYDMNLTVGAPWYEYSDSIRKVIIEDGVTDIGNDAFAFCDKIKSVEMADSVLSIGMFAFGQCQNMKSIKMSQNIVFIGSLAFTYCTSLESIEIPDGVKTIYISTFNHCESLESITLPASLRLIEDYAFDGCGDFTAYVYEDSYAEEYMKKNKFNYELIGAETGNSASASGMSSTELLLMTIYIVAGLLIAVIVAVIIVLIVKRNKEN